MIGLIAACDIYGLIGFGNEIPWKSPADMRRFKKLTVGDGESTVIMGSKTYQSIGKPLINRKNIVLTSKPKKIINHTQLRIHNNLAILLDELKKNKKPVWIIGGAEVYRQALETNMVDFIDLTILNMRWFPPQEVTEEEWKQKAVYFPYLPMNYSIVKEEVNSEDRLLLHRRYEPAIW